MSQFVSLDQGLVRQGEVDPGAEAIPQGNLCCIRVMCCSQTFKIWLHQPQVMAKIRVGR